MSRGSRFLETVEWQAAGRGRQPPRLLSAGVYSFGSAGQQPLQEADPSAWEDLAWLSPSRVPILRPPWTCGLSY